MRRTLQCPYCWYVTVSECIGAVYCGPHEREENGYVRGAVEMRERDALKPGDADEGRRG